MESAQPDDPFADPSVTTAQDVHVEIGNAPAESHSLLDDDPPAKTAAPTAAAAAAEPQPAAAAAVPANTFCGCFSVAYYKPFFDVDTEDIQARIKTVAIPERDIEKHAFLQLAADRPGACAQTSPLLHCRRGPGYCDARRAAHTRCSHALPAVTPLLLPVLALRRHVRPVLDLHHAGVLYGSDLELRQLVGVQGHARAVDVRLQQDC